MFDITAFGETKKLTEHLAELVYQRRDTLSQDMANLITAALATIQCHETWLAQADAREARLMERLDRLEKAVVPQERRWLVKGKVYHTPYLNDERHWEDTRIITAPTREDAERLFVEHWNNKSEQHGDSYWAYVTHCSGELG